MYAPCVKFIPSCNAAWKELAEIFRRRKENMRRVQNKRKTMIIKTKLNISLLLACLLMYSCSNNIGKYEWEFIGVGNHQKFTTDFNELFDTIYNNGELIRLGVIDSSIHEIMLNKNLHRYYLQFSNSFPLFNGLHGSVEGNFGCNRFHGSYFHIFNKIVFKDISTTLTYCPSDDKNFILMYNRYLTTSNKLQFISKDTLVLENSYSNCLLFAKQTNNAKKIENTKDIKEHAAEKNWNAAK